MLAIGAAVPADCKLNKGQIECDEAALTGESMPSVKHPGRDFLPARYFHPIPSTPLYGFLCKYLTSIHLGSECLMGSSVARGETEATVTFTGIYMILQHHIVVFRY